jgi:putative NADH-flavin reductase
MKILIIGATRGVGLELTKQALEQNHEVTILVRKPNEVFLKDNNLKILKGDILDERSVEKAVENQDAVCTSIGINLTLKPVTIFSEGAKNVVAAMQSANVNRLVAVTGIGAGDSRGHGGFLYDQIFNRFLVRTIYADKDREEAIIRASNLNWTIARPGFLTNNPKTGKYRALTDLTNVIAGKISRADVADFILREIETNQFVHQTPLLTI